MLEPDASCVKYHAISCILKKPEAVMSSKGFEPEVPRGVPKATTVGAEDAILVLMANFLTVPSLRVQRTKRGAMIKWNTRNLHFVSHKYAFFGWAGLSKWLLEGADCSNVSRSRSRSCLELKLRGEPLLIQSCLGISEGEDSAGFYGFLAGI